jgi:hypothetical protein
MTADGRGSVVRTAEPRPANRSLGAASPRTVTP